MTKTVYILLISLIGFQSLLVNPYDPFLSKEDKADKNCQLQTREQSSEFLVLLKEPQTGVPSVLRFLSVSSFLREVSAAQAISRPGRIEILSRSPFLSSHTPTLLTLGCLLTV